MASLANVVLDLCRRAGLSPEAVDVSALTGTCDGLVISNVASVRSTLEHLVRANFLDVIESSGMIVFRPRGNAPVATISPPAVRAIAAAPLGSQPIAASAAAGKRDRQGAEGSLAPAGQSLRSTLWTDPTARGGLDFDRHPFLSTFVVVGTILAGLLITARIRRGQDDGPEHVQPKVADSAVVAKGSAVVPEVTVVATKAPPRPKPDPT